MSEPLHVRIRSAKTPLEAIQMLVDEVDTLTARVNELTRSPQADPWAAPLDWGATTQQPTPATSQDLASMHAQGEAANAAAAQQRKIAKLEARIAEEVDPDNVRALEAQLRLAKEEHVHLPSPAVPSLEPEEGGVIEVPPPSPERMAKRMQWAWEVGLVDYMMNSEAIRAGNAIEELYANFAKVGPKGLYVMDRLAILQMPVAARQWLVEDMAEDDLAYAQNMGADILKSEEGLDRETARELYEPTWKG